MIQIGNQASPNFSDPLGMLRACHQRMLDLCDLLDRMCEHQEQKGIDQAMSESARQVIRYFEIAAPQHHADEEENLFPNLSNNSQLQNQINKLTQEHRQHDKLWEKLKPCLKEIESGKHREDLLALSKPFVNAYREHIKIENEQILPQAKTYLSNNVLQSIGQAMAARRKTSR